MGRWRRVAWLVVATLGIGLAVSQLGVSWPRTLTVVDRSGRPLDDVYLGYLLSGYRFNFVDSISYEVHGGVVRTDHLGRATIPLRLYHKYPLDTYASPRLELLYAPGLHFARQVVTLNSGIPGLLEVADGGRRLVLDDLAGRPAEWERSLDAIDRFVWSYAVGPERRRRESAITVPATVTRELACHLRLELDELVAYHAATPRTETVDPSYLARLSDDERAATLTRVRADLAREPFWGPRVERLWRRRATRLEQELARLP